MQGQGGRIARACLVALEIAGALLALAAGLAVLLFWRLQSGPVSLSLFTQSAEFAIERALPPRHRARIDRASLSRADKKGDYQVSLDGIHIEGPERAPIADLPNVTLLFALDNILRGELGPKRLRVVKPTLRIERGADRRFTLDYADRAAAESEGNVFELLTGGPFFRGAFEEAELVDATVHFRDAASGRSWRADAADASITRYEDGYAAVLAGVFDLEGKAATLSLNATYLETTELITAEVDVVDAPVGDILEMFFGEPAGVFAAPLTGSASIMLTRSGEVISSRLEGRSGAGVLTLAERAIPVESVDVLADFDPARDIFDVERLAFAADGSRGVLSGTLKIDFGGDALSPASLLANVSGRDLVIDAKGALPAPLEVSQFSASIGYDFDAERVSITGLSADLVGTTLSGDFSHAASRDPQTARRISAEMTANLAIAGSLDPERVLRIWPLRIGAGARDFVARRIPRGRVENIVFRLDLPAGAIESGAPTPDEAMALTFDIVEATAFYAPKMPPLTNASGRATLTGNRFRVEGARGRVGEIPIADGEIDFTALSPRGAPTIFRFAAQGPVQQMLEVLNNPPISVLNETTLDPARFVAGDAETRVEIVRPNRRDVAAADYAYKGTAAFRDLTISEFYRGIDLAHANGSIDLKTGAMTLAADAELGGAPIELQWRRSLSAEDARSEFQVSGVVDSSTGDVFGVPTRQFLRGPVSFDAEATGDLGAIDALKVSADFKDAALSIDMLDWTKPIGAAATGDVEMTFDEFGVNLRRAQILGEGVDLAGRAQIDPAGGLTSATFERVKFEGGADVSLNLSRGAGGIVDVSLTGAYLNAGPFIESQVASPPEMARRDSVSDEGGFALRARIDALEMRGGAQYRDASLDFTRAHGAIQALSFSARTGGGAPLSLVLKQTGADTGPAQAIEARTEDLGQFLRGAFGVASIQGGEGSMEILANRGDGASRGLTGKLAARNMRVVGAPLLARVFAAGSLTGLADLLNGQGIDLTRAEADFSFADGVLTLSGARASGPSVGITAEGSVTTGEGSVVDLHGAIAPAYQVNSLLGNAPIIGDLLVNREGEGLVALSYDVNGRSDAPLVAVNPLSALTPGFLRRIFEDEPPPEAPRASPEAPEETPD